MSEPLRIALVAEGPTDYEVIAAALRAVLTQPFVMTLLQPEATQPQFGGGWGGVLKWCHTTSRRHTGPLSQDPTLALFDLIVLHLDVDVAAKRYADCGPAVAEMAHAFNWKPLPCHRPCPPASDTGIELQHVLTTWLAPATADARTLCCMPAQSSGTWLACAVLDPAHALLKDAECHPDLEAQFSQLPKTQRIKKTVPEYRRLSVALTSRWEHVKQRCRQADAFERAVLTTTASLPSRPA